MVTLVLACVFMAGWVRSLNTGDMLILPIRQHSKDSMTSVTADWLGSGQGSVVCGRYHMLVEANQVDDLIMIYFRPIYRTGESTGQFNLVNFGNQWQWQCCGFGLCGHPEEQDDTWQWILFIPYWSIVIPLTLISLWLLLSKPRQSNQKKTSEPVPEKAA